MTESMPEDADCRTPVSGAKRLKESHSGMSFDGSILTVYAKNLRDDFGQDTESQLPLEEAIQFLKDIAPNVTEVFVYGKEADVEIHFGKISRDYRAALKTSVDDTVDEYLLYELEDSPLTKLTLQHVSFLNPVSINGLMDKCAKRNIELIVDNIQINTDQSIFLKEAADIYGDEGYVLEITGRETLMKATLDNKTNGSGDSTGKNDDKYAQIVEMAGKYAPEVPAEKREELTKQLVKLQKDEEMEEEVENFVKALLKQYAPDLLEDEEKVDVSNLNLSKLDTLPLRLVWWWVSTWADPNGDSLREDGHANGANGTQKDEFTEDSVDDDRKISMVHRGKKRPGTLE
ncbi:hypothetical protein RvY_04768 [Ramazzottius varieornatus]|uniref:Uncharacterized protein n=1 Tax=Ramazzottius varieornatus TaxID=947166 RepID=A0A1D1UTD8_RAMVA|nr:hypothetical protein RvY_04768 [Ramazzottius varieornatus]